MTKPSDQVEGAKAPVGRPRTIGMINPGFREDHFDPSTAHSQKSLLGIRKPGDPRDWRNIKFALLAVSVSVLIFGILEYKQVYEAAREAKQSAYGTARAVKHSIFDLFKE